MKKDEAIKRIISSATPLLAVKGLHGTNVRELARSAGVNPAMISYYFGGKDGLYEAVLAEQFACLNLVAQIARMDIPPAEKFRAYVFQCGICFHEGEESEFTPLTASADIAAPECPRCLNNDAASFSKQVIEETKAA